MLDTTCGLEESQAVCQGDFIRTLFGTRRKEGDAMLRSAEPREFRESHSIKVFSFSPESGLRSLLIVHSACEPSAKSAFWGLGDGCPGRVATFACT